MTDPPHSQPLHAALHSVSEPLSVPTILACPLPLSLLPPEELLPELGHELKTPLTGIMSLSQVMQRQVSSGERSAQYADLIYQKSQQLLTAINDLLDLTQLCTHQFILQLQAVEFYSAFNTALQVAQRMAGQTLKVTYQQDLEAAERLSQVNEPRPEEWIVADRARVEQLLIHLLGYLLLQNLPEHSLTLHLSVRGNWLSLTLSVASLTLSEYELISLGWISQPSDSEVSAVPYRSGAMLKFLLARRLAHLQGAEITWHSNIASGTSITVLFPRDLTHTTALSRTSNDIPTWMVLAQQSAAIDAVMHVLPSQSSPLVVARSLPEAQEKVRLLSPSVLLMNCAFAKACGLNVLQEWLNQQRFSGQVQLVWIGGNPFSEPITGPSSTEIWPLPLSLEQLPAALYPRSTQGIPKLPTVTSSPQTTKSSRPLTLLQIDSSTGAETPSPLILELLAQLSKRYGCSILAVSDAAQAELLIQIWKPRVVVCPGTLPQWMLQISKTSLLAALPIVLLQTSNTTPSNKTQHYPLETNGIHCVPFLVEGNSLQAPILADKLYQQLIATTQ